MDATHEERDSALDTKSAPGIASSVRRTHSSNDTTAIADGVDPTSSPPLTSASRSQSWTTLMRKKSTNMYSGTTTENGDSLDTVTQSPPPARVLSTLASLASPSTYYRPASRLFNSRPSSSAGASNRPSSSSSSASSAPSQSGFKFTPVTSPPAPSDNNLAILPPTPSRTPTPTHTTTATSAAANNNLIPPTSSRQRRKSKNSNPEELEARAQALILNALDRTRSEQSPLLTRKRTLDSQPALSPSPYMFTKNLSPAPSPHPSHTELPAPAAVKPSSSSTGWTSLLSFSSRDKADKDKPSDLSRSSLDLFTSSPSGSGSLRSPKVTKKDKERPTSVPLSPSPQIANALRTTVPIATIIEGVAVDSPLSGGGSNNSSNTGVPLFKSMTMDSTYSESGEQPRGRNKSKRLSGPFNIFRSRSRNNDTPTNGGGHPHRDPSPHIAALQCNASDYESDGDTIGTPGGRRGGRWGKKGKTTKVRNSAFQSAADDGATEGEETEADDDNESSWSSDSDEDDDGDENGGEDDGDNGFDPVTEQNTSANAYPAAEDDMHSLLLLDDDDLDMPDPLGEGVNVVRPEEPMFAKTFMGHTSAPSSPTPKVTVPRPISALPAASPEAAKESKPLPASTSSSTHPSAPPSTPAEVAARTPRRKKTLKPSHITNDPLPLAVSRPVFARDRCTVVVTHGDPRGAATSGRREPKRYVVFSDLSEESKWAVEWGIGTVLRDGDEMILVTVQETDSKLDPVEGAPAGDRLQKLRNQQERQALASLLVRQATSLLQRTKLNITVTCQALHAKNARRLFLDVIDLVEPTMVIVGSRGLSHVKGILLGSTSHYLIQKSSAPVMVARRRLKRPKSAKKSHTAAQALELMRTKQRVALADAAIEKVSSGKGSGGMGVQLEDLKKDDERAEKEWPRVPGEDESEDSDQGEGEVSGDVTPLEEKVAGEV
ncbi:hypothetical protein FRB93_008638 [Tulasnella sp. JGI-2019a]|nr:hypothetical protein FRB93_008638 [Tulasnella sp. JGI-2019a]